MPPLLLDVVFLALLKISWCADLTAVLHNKYTTAWCVWCVRGWGGGERELDMTGIVKERRVNVFHRIRLHGSKIHFHSTRETRRYVRGDSFDGQQSPSLLLSLKHFNICIVRLWRKEGGRGGWGGKKGRRKEGGKERGKEAKRNGRRKKGGKERPNTPSEISYYCSTLHRDTESHWRWMKKKKKMMKREKSHKGTMSSLPLYH